MSLLLRLSSPKPAAVPIKTLLFPRFVTGSVPLDDPALFPIRIL
jgi:hypothetical protein